VLENYLSLRVDNKADVEEAVFQVGVSRLGLGDDDSVVLARDFPQFFGFFPGYVDGALPRELHMIEIEYLVVEGLQSPFGDCDETHRNTQGGKPTGCLDQMMQMIEVDLDVLTAPNSTNRRNEPNGGVRFDHGCVLAAWRRMGEQCPAAKIFWQGGLTVPLPGCF